MSRTPVNQELPVSGTPGISIPGVPDTSEMLIAGVRDTGEMQIVGVPGTGKMQNAGVRDTGDLQRIHSGKNCRFLGHQVKCKMPASGTPGNQKLHRQVIF